MLTHLRRRTGLAVAYSLLAAGLVVGSAVAQDAEPPATRPAERELSVVLPYSLLEDMTEAQRDEIVEIRTDIMERRRQLDAEEESRILEVLTLEQREALPELEREYRRERAAERRARRSAEDDVDAEANNAG